MSRSNLTYDGTYKYTYDAWNRLVKATLEDEDVVIQSAAFDGLDRRIRKTVTNSGDLDGVTVYLYNGQQIIETRDGSGNVETQVPARRDGTSLTRRKPLRGSIASRSASFARCGESRNEVVGLRLKDVGRALDMRELPNACCAVTARQGQVYLHQGERSEREPPTTGKVSRDANVRAASLPGMSTQDAGD